MKYSSSYASGMYAPRLLESSKGLPQIFHFAKLDDSLPVFSAGLPILSGRKLAYKSSVNLSSRLCW